jgi:PKD repeat protein
VPLYPHKNGYLKYVPAGTPDFTATPVEGIAPLCVAYSIINPPQSWEFNFGDNSTATGAQATHCFGTSGNYFPSLTYCSNNLCDTVEGKEPIIVHQPRILISQGGSLNEYRFSTDAPEGLRYTWDFGDGTGASGAAPTHRFETEGTYRVSLVVTGSCGCNAITAKN